MVLEVTGAESPVADTEQSVEFYNWRSFNWVTTRKKNKVDYTKMIVDLCCTSSIEPTSVNEARKDKFWINAIAAEDVETAPSVSESHISEMDLDERDDVPLATLLRKELFSNVEPSVADVPITSAHSDESSSSEDIFVPTPSHPFATNEEDFSKYSIYSH
ncbi:putative mitochondrial protein [Cucumis melo var. makuwa]|uniref:Mitochondrial protein n=1 Tax=Cucumis melo var. makuwa TaxID=1194695 RepID=A0A5A7UUU1_CUCMM|nr:putative mitochondrial protein [Cucumis melo var. makuwa]TYK11010.1 putative mitochondrial protein [Cucumis melo var. makuwa]